MNQEFYKSKLHEFALKTVNAMSMEQIQLNIENAKISNDAKVYGISPNEILCYCNSNMEKLKLELEQSQKQKTQKTDEAA